MSNPFLESPRFPSCPSFGFTARPRYRTEIITRLTGRQDRFRIWEHPLHDYTVTVGPRQEAEISRLIEFFHAVGGDYYGFRFRDYSDFKSCHIDGTPAAIDQPTVALGGDDFQLIKRYTAGTLDQDRLIRKPLAQILIADAGTPVTSGWTLDAATGVVSFDAAPTGPVTWGGLFDVPVRFSGDFPVEILNLRAQTVSFGLEELREEDEAES